MMTNFDKLKDTTFGDLFRAMNGNEPSRDVFANFVYEWTSCIQCPCFKDCSANFVDCYSTKIRSPSTCQSQLHKWLESEFEEDSQQSTSLITSQGDFMELEQAIKELKAEYLGDSHAVISAKKIAIAAIEKQMPKPVLVTKDYFFCPCCHSDEGAIRSDYCIPYDYCTKCGQRLDWIKREYIDERP